MKFLVTGGLGFIGQRVVRNLLGRGVPTVSADHTEDAEATADLRAVARAAPTPNSMPCPWTSAIFAT